MTHISERMLNRQPEPPVLSETTLYPRTERGRDPHPRRTGKGSPMRLPAEAVVNKEKVMIVEQVSYSEEHGSTWKTADGRVLVAKDVNFLQG